MRIFALIFALLLAGCSRPAPWHMTDISGGMPRLKFHMTSGGKPVSAEDFRGKVVALYFGFTHCPDVCPATLANLTDMLGKVSSPDVRILFVTVDPDRDSDAVMADYAKAFSPQMVGLRGGRNELANLETFSTGLNFWEIRYNDTTGGSNFTGDQLSGSYVTITAVPEPASLALVGAVAMFLLARGRRR